MLKHHFDLIPCLNLIILFDDDTVYPNVPSFGGLLDFVSRSVLNEVHQEFIHTKWFLPL